MDGYLTITETASRCGLAESTLRYWERVGLVPAVGRHASSGHRRYRMDEVEQLETSPTSGRSGSASRTCART